MIVSITLSSATKAGIIGDAIRSVRNQVDACLVVYLEDPECIPDTTLAVAAYEAGAKFRQATVQLASMGFADMRNAGLDAATALGADYAIILDTDERIHFNGLDLAAWLAAQPPEVDTWSSCCSTGEYTKPRVFRLPTARRYRGDTHEDIGLQQSMIPRLRFSELPKAPEIVPDYLAGQMKGLDQQCLDDPSNHRWPYYRGHVLLNQKRYEEAIDAFLESLNLTKDPGHSAWTCFQIAVCYHLLERPESALRWSVLGLEHDASYPELAWLAGIQSLIMCRWNQALSCAQLALAHSWIGQDGPMTERLGFRCPVALFDGPWSIMGEAYHAMKCEPDELAAARMMDVARQARLAFFERGEVWGKEGTNA